MDDIDLIATDPRIPGFFEDFCAAKLARFGVRWKEYRAHRLAGTWNAEVRRRFSHEPERFMVEEGDA